ncbi:hypothetical protein J4459_04080 [Candidatus Woesearchaeota archaeon]|nr:hypothetical protein [Candidatus Woesearchaeota archaeon]
MKMGWISLILIFLIIGSVSVLAEIRLDPLSGSIFNLGDQIIVSGAIVSGASQRMTLNLDLVCASSSSSLYIKTIDLKKDLESSFSRLIVIPSIVAGDCKFVASLSDGDSVKESVESGQFAISNKFKGAFEIVDSIYQLGETIPVVGVVTRESGDPVDGKAIVYFKKDGKTVLIESVDVVAGDMAMNKELNLMPPGNYIISIEVSDSLGNKHLFEEALTFELLGNLNLELKTDKESYSPGSNLVISGIVRSSVAQSVLKGLEVTARLGDIELVQPVTGENLNLVYQLPSNIKTGTHKIDIIIKDENGNYGSQGFTFKINPLATTLGMKMDKSEFAPDEKVEFDVVLYDQANDPMPGSVMLKVYDKNNELRAEQDIAVNKKTNFDLPEQALPGPWKISLNGLGLSSEQNFVVREVKKLDVVVVDGGKLKVRNIGNVDFSGPLSFVAEGVEKVKEIILSPSGEQEIHLADLFDEGVHDIQIPLLDKVLEGVSIVDDRTLLQKLKLDGITGKAVGDKGTGNFWVALGVIALVLGVVLLGFSILRKVRSVEDKPHVHSNSSWDDEFVRGQKRAKELKKLDEEIPKKKYKYNFGKASEADIADFKRRMVRLVQDEEENRKRFASRKWQETPPRMQESSGFQMGRSKPEFDIKRMPSENKEDSESPFKKMFG